MNQSLQVELATLPRNRLVTHNYIVVEVQSKLRLSVYKTYCFEIDFRPLPLVDIARTTCGFVSYIVR